MPSCSSTRSVAKRGTGRSSRAWVSFATKQQVRRFPDLLQRLKLALQPVDLGAGQGVWYKVLAGPFAGADAAGRICQAIRSRAPANDCSVVTD